MISSRDLVVGKLAGAVVGQAGHGRLRRVPVPLAVHVEIGRAVGEPAERIAEGGDGLAGLHAAELHLPVVDAAMRCPQGRRRTHVDRPRNAAAGGIAAKVRVVAIQAERQRIAPVHVLLDDRNPLVFEVAGQLELHDLVVHGDVARHDEHVAVLPFPERMDHGGHQAQHAAGPLELVERGPVVVEPVEHLRVNRVGHLDPAFVVGFAAFGRELLLLRAVQIDESAGNGVAGNELVAGERLEQPAADDLEAFVRAGRPPGCFDAADGVLEPGKRLAATFAADFDVGDAALGLLVRAFRSRNAHDEQRVLGGLGRFAQCLGEGEVRLETCRPAGRPWCAAAGRRRPIRRSGSGKGRTC